ncbi:MAG: TIGR04211 family SH3 domain-containing protein [Pseudomonadota bacterium]
MAAALMLVATVAVLPEAATAQTRYVTDEFEITLRRGPSTQNAITRMLQSGTALEVLEVDTDNGYTRVRTAGGTEGWVLTRYLQNEQSARDRLAAMQQRLEALRGESGSQGRILDDLRQQNATNEGRIRTLESENKRLEAELAEIRRTAANAISINEQNRVLREDLSQANIKVSTLEQENDRLVRRRDQNWFLIGAAVLVIGIILGLVLPRIPRSRRNRWSDSL